MSQFTDGQIKNWKSYEKVRVGGKYNMFDSRARRAAKLSDAEYSFVIQNYSKLKAAADKEAA
jgi:hypothetical protein